MTVSRVHHDELLTLLAAVCDEQATEAQRQRLDQILAADASARSVYLRYMALHAAMGRLRVQQRVQDSGGRVQQRMQGSGFRIQIKTGLALAAAVVAVAVTVWFVVLPEPRTPTPEPAVTSAVALLSNMSSDASFGEGLRMLGADLTPGLITLRRGQAQIMFRSGAVVELTGPCEFETTGVNQGFLHSGKLEATVPPQAHNFTVGAPYGLSVVDLGTRFAMSTDEDMMRLRVLEGRVDLVVTQDRPMPQRIALEVGHIARLVRGRLVQHLGGERQIVLNPDADTYISGRTPDKSLGAEARLIANEWTSSGPRWTMIRFDLTKLADPITTARLELTSRLVNPQANTFAVYGLAGEVDWVETGDGALTYANTPWRRDGEPDLDAMFGGAPLAWFKSTEAADQVAVAFDSVDESPLLAFLNQHLGGRVTFVIAENEPMPDGIGDAWDSRESNHPPRLILNMASEIKSTGIKQETSPVKGSE